MKFEEYDIEVESEVDNDVGIESLRKSNWIGVYGGS